MGFTVTRSHTSRTLMRDLYIRPHALQTPTERICFVRTVYISPVQFLRLAEFIARHRTATRTANMLFAVFFPPLLQHLEIQEDQSNEKKNNNTYSSLSQCGDDVAQSRERFIDIFSFIQDSSFCSCFTDLKGRRQKESERVKQFTHAPEETKTPNRACLFQQTKNVECDTSCS